jgi:hypothetical protein
MYLHILGTGSFHPSQRVVHREIYGKDTQVNIIE